MFNRDAVYKALQPLLVEYTAKDWEYTAFPVSFIYDFIDGNPVGKTILKMDIYPEPFEGKVIIIDKQAVVVEEKKRNFFIIDKSLLEQVPDIGDKVKVTPYYKKEFNGQKLGEPYKENTWFMDGLVVHERQSRIIGITGIPGKEVKNASLQLLILNLQSFKLSDGYRTITDLLVSVAAKDFTVHDPVQARNNLLPSIEFAVHSHKFKGKVKINCMPAPRVYRIMFLIDDAIDMVHDVSFEELANFFEEHLQDDSWKKPCIKILAKAKPTV